MVTERDGLRGLQMGEARHDRRGVLAGTLRQRELISGELRVDAVDGVADPQPEIGCHLVVARARGMQPPGGRSDQVGEARFHVHVDVLERALELEPAGLDL